MRPIRTQDRHRKPDQAGFVRQVIVLGVVLIVLFGLFDAYKTLAAHQISAVPEIRSGIAGYCLDDHHDGAGPNAEVDTWACDGSAAQDWTVSADTIRHGGSRCLGVQNEGTSAGDAVVLNGCNGSPGQVWTVDLGGFENPNSGLCLAVPNTKTNEQLIVYSCNDLSKLDEAWSAGTWTDNNGSGVACDNGSKGARVACYAQQQWLAWQSGSPSHQKLLAAYTDGNGYEQWCADFVSYVYRRAGYPFAAGERDGWDEYDANNIQNMGFTMHSASGYQPKPGDVAFFDYSGGHVEIVVSGDPNPTFVYGDSGTTDPGTGNGEMNEDTLTSDGSAGQVIYYLSPN